MVDPFGTGENVIRALSEKLYCEDYPVHTALWLLKLSLPEESHSQAPGWHRLPGPALIVAPIQRPLLFRLAWCFAFFGAGSGYAPITRPRDVFDEAPYYFKGPGHEPMDEDMVSHSWKVLRRALICYRNAAEGRQNAAYRGIIVRTAGCYWVIRGAVLDKIFGPLHDALLADRQRLTLDEELTWSRNCFKATYERTPRPNRTQQERDEEQEWRKELGTVLYSPRQTRPRRTPDLLAPVEGLGPYALQYRGLPLFDYQSLRGEYKSLLGVPLKSRSSIQFMSENDWQRLDDTNEDFAPWLGSLYQDPKTLTMTAWSNEAAFKLDHPSRRNRSHRAPPSTSSE